MRMASENEMDEESLERRAFQGAQKRRVGGRRTRQGVRPDSQQASRQGRAEETGEVGTDRVGFGHRACPRIRAEGLKSWAAITPLQRIRGNSTYRERGEVDV